jgi:pimeloyl-ACP methyl ester carboxylesterase
VSLKWVLLRGLGRESGHWGPFLPALAAAMPSREVVALDLPGTGSRLSERGPRSMREIVDRVREDAASRGLTRAPLFLFGISLGGMAALEWAGSHPEEVAGVVVAASSAPDLSPMLRRLTPWGFVAVALGRVIRTPERRQRILAHLVSSRRDLRESLVRSWAQIERERPVSPENLSNQLAAAARWRAPRSLAVPSLFLVGQRDRFVHPDCSRALARRYGAPLVEHASAGHDLTTDAPEWVVDQVVRFAVA